MQFQHSLIALIAVVYAGTTMASVTADEAKKLGSTLTPVGAEKAGNADGSIPPWSGGLTTPPACFKKGDERLCDPFGNEKPVFSINAGNANNYADKLSDGQKAMLKKYPSYRMDVYPTHRTAAFPKWIYDNTAKNAVRAKTTNAGIGIEGAHAGVPFPIPSDGFEAMWNHLTRYNGQAYAQTTDSYNVDANGTVSLAVRTNSLAEYPYYDQNKPDNELYWKLRHNYTAPARQAGGGVILLDPLNAAEKGRRAWQYLPGQRRVKLAPDLSYDTPASQNAGACFYDDVYMFNGSMERFDFKLVGKKEIYVPYNTYKYVWTASYNDMLKPNFINPAVMRWELHRVWVVEATVKEGKRHSYSKRRFYLDEDSWFALLNESYDARGQIWRTAVHNLTPNYVALVPGNISHVYYDLNSGVYSLIGALNDTGKLSYMGAQRESEFSPDALAGSGIR